MKSFIVFFFALVLALPAMAERGSFKGYVLDVDCMEMDPFEWGDICLIFARSESGADYAFVTDFDDFLDEFYLNDNEGIAYLERRTVTIDYDSLHLIRNRDHLQVLKEYSQSYFYKTVDSVSAITFGESLPPETNYRNKTYRAAFLAYDDSQRFLLNIVESLSDFRPEELCYVGRPNEAVRLMYVYIDMDSEFLVGDEHRIEAVYAKGDKVILEVFDEWSFADQDEADADRDEFIEKFAVQKCD
jgi:hypothetical protein